MHKNQSKTGRIAVSIGGFLIMIGMILIGIFFLAIFRILDPELLTSEDFAKVFMSILITAGVLDFVSGLMLSHR
ncbi:MAG: hypothetical protein ACE5NN_00260 [Candidatus Bathyarchaeia archaeon]